MDTNSLQRSYEIFSKMLLEDKIFMDKDITFSLICFAIKANRKELNKLIKKELGFTGPELMKLYRSMEFERIIDKYKI